MDGLLSQGLHYREPRFGVVIIGTDVVEAGIHKRTGADGKDAQDNGDGDAVMLDVLFHDEFPLEPESDAGHDLPVDNGLMILSCVVRRGTDATYPVHAAVGRKLPAHPVPQPQTELHLADAAPDPTLPPLLPLPLAPAPPSPAPPP